MSQIRLPVAVVVLATMCAQGTFNAAVVANLSQYYPERFAAAGI